MYKLPYANKFWNLMSDLQTKGDIGPETGYGVLVEGGPKAALAKDRWAF